MKQKNQIKQEKILNSNEDIETLFNEEYYSCVCWGNLYLKDAKKYYYCPRNGNVIKTGFKEKWYDAINDCEGVVNEYENTKIKMILAYAR